MPNNTFDLIVRGGQVVSPRGVIAADVGVRDGRICAVADRLDPDRAAATIDAGGLHVLPGCFDTHMHLWETGFTSRPDFRDSTLEAAYGGITTILDHPLTIPEILNADGFREKVALGQATSYVDFGLHAGISPHNLADLQGMWDEGATAFKIFMCHSGSKVEGLSDGELIEAFRTVSRFGGIVLLHAEADQMVQYNRARLEAAGRKDPLAFLESRPPEVESEAIRKALHFVELSGVRAIFAHTSVPEGIAAIEITRAKGHEIWVETCPHYLYFTTDDMQRLGPYVKFSPTVRDPVRVEGLWRDLAAGRIQLMGSDHGPVEKARKERGWKSIWEGQGGMPSVEVMVPLMLNAVAEGRLTIERLGALLSEQPARIFGLFPRKGIIQTGSDADLTLVDLKSDWTVSVGRLHANYGYTPYEGQRIQGRVVHTIVRGRSVVADGELIGKPGWGRFHPRAEQGSRVVHAAD